MTIRKRNSWAAGEHFIKEYEVRRKTDKECQSLLNFLDDASASRGKNSSEESFS